MLSLLLGAAAAIAQPPLSYLDLAPELTSKIAAVLPDVKQVQLTLAEAEPAVRDIERELVRLLTARGIQVVSTPARNAMIAVGCAQNLRERVCIGEIRRGETLDVVAAVSAHSTPAPGESNASIALEAHPLFGRRAAILDVANLDDRLLVLGPSNVALYHRSGDGWEPLQSRDVVSSRVWPRDVRGRLRVAGTTIEAFLPGVVCRAPVDVPALTCVEEREAWPLPIANSGIDASRNTFQTPEGLTFFAAAALDDGAGAHTVVVDASGNLSLLDESRRAVGTVGAADAVVELAGRCGRYLLTGSGTKGADTDTLQLWRVMSRQKVAVASPIMLPGRLTALWPSERPGFATAVVHDVPARRYEAFQITVACDR